MSEMARQHVCEQEGAVKQMEREREEDRRAIREMAWALKCLAEWEDEPNHGMAGFARGSLMKNAPHIQRATQAPA